MFQKIALSDIERLCTGALVLLTEVPSMGLTVTVNVFVALLAVVMPLTSLRLNIVADAQNTLCLFLSFCFILAQLSSSSCH